MRRVLSLPVAAVCSSSGKAATALAVGGAPLILGAGGLLLRALTCACQHSQLLVVQASSGHHHQQQQQQAVLQQQSTHARPDQHSLACGVWVQHSRAAWPASTSTSSSSCSCWRSSSSARSFASSAVAASDDNPADVPRRRRRSATESNAVLRRTTESRAAIEDVAVMTRNQLLRRNKPWLAEQCWQHGLSHEGLKDDLIQRLLTWQDTEAGQAAAVAAQEAAAAARAAVAAATAAASRPTPAPAAAAAAPASGVSSSSQQQAVPQANVPSSAGAASSSSSSAPAVPAAAATAAGEAARLLPERSQVVRPAAGAYAAAAVALPADLEADGSDEEVSNTAAADANAVAAAPAAGAPAGSTSSSSAAAAASEAPQGAAVGWQQPPLSAAAAATDSVGLYLGQLKQQPGNAAIVAAARNAVEQYTQHVLSGAAAGGGQASSSSMQQQVSQLAATVSEFSSPQSLAALAKACYSRELQNPVLAAGLAEAVAAVAAQLGPQEVYGVLRLLVEHLAGAQDAVGLRTMDKGFRVLAEAMICCSEALKPVQLAEAVELLGVHGYGDAFGLWMIAKEAAARVIEFDPVKEGGSVVQLLDAIAGMHVADDAMTGDVAAAVAARRGEFSAPQLAAVAAALRRMGYEDCLDQCGRRFLRHIVCLPGLAGGR